MTCSSVDLKAYMLGEVPESEKGLVAAHVRECASCGEEMERLSLTHLALVSLRDEEVPRRIAFVSDKVFEPRWYQKLFLRPSFAAAMVIAAAILVHAFARPVGLPNTTAQVDTRAIESRVSAEVTARLQSEMATAVNAAVTKAVADTEKREDQRAAMLLSAADKRYSEDADFLNKQVTRIYALNTGAGVR
jgi:anti-sigma factor RsiW